MPAGKCVASWCQPMLPAFCADCHILLLLPRLPALPQAYAYAIHANRLRPSCPAGAHARCCCSCLPPQRLLLVQASPSHLRSRLNGVVALTAPKAACWACWAHCWRHVAAWRAALKSSWGEACSKAW